LGRIKMGAIFGKRLRFESVSLGWFVNCRKKREDL